MGSEMCIRDRPKPAIPPSCIICIEDKRTGDLIPNKEIFKDEIILVDAKGVPAVMVSGTSTQVRRPASRENAPGASSKAAPPTPVAKARPRQSRSPRLGDALEQHNLDAVLAGSSRRGRASSARGGAAPRESSIVSVNSEPALSLIHI